MFIVYANNNNGGGKSLRPAPLVSIAFNAKRNKGDFLGGDYSITLNGTILASGGSPFQDGDDPLGRNQAVGPNWNESTGSTKPSEPNTLSAELSSYAILRKQEAIRALFGRDGQKMEICPIDGTYPLIVCYPNVDSVSFEDGIFVNTCRYTINLSTPILYGADGTTPFADSFPLSRNHNAFLDTKYQFNSNGSSWVFPSGLVEDYNESWAIEVDDSFFLRTPTATNVGTRSIPRCYRLTRNISATGKVKYYNDGGTVKRFEAWEGAKNFIIYNVLFTGGNPTSDTHRLFPDLARGSFGYDLLSLKSDYKGFNHVRTENIDTTAGSYTVSDTWILTSGINNTIESYELSANSSTGSPFATFTVNGKIKGLIPDDPIDKIASSNKLIAFDNAMKEYHRLSSNDIFGTGCILYKRAGSLTSLTLNPNPVSNNYTVNKALGEIDYTVTFDNRPNTFFTNVSSENVTITDTYPGDVFAMMPTINRSTGPLFQYLGGITQYERSVSIEFTVDKVYLNNHAAKMNAKGAYLMRCPSRSGGQLMEQLNELIISLSPRHEPNIRKYVINPITESWDPKSGKYNVNISWVYELNQ